jgi:hypothetical protein
MEFGHALVVRNSRTGAISLVAVPHTLFVNPMRLLIKVAVLPSLQREIADLVAVELVYKLRETTPTQ